jgi:16S rRNA (guanine1207-N2)-methyltransferase
MESAERIEARGDRREARVAGALLGDLPTAEGSVLVVDDLDGAVESAWGGARWSRVCRGRRLGSVWPEEGPFDTVSIRLGKSRVGFEMALHAVAGRLAPGGRVYVYGGNDEGIKSASSKIERVFGQCETQATRRKCRILEASAPLPDPRSELADWRRSVPRPDGGVWVTYPGLFAQGGLDPGTALLLSVLPKIDSGDRVLDFGCGSGVISAAVRRGAPKARIDALDADALALEALRENVPDARPLLGDAWEGVSAGGYAFILSNPPFHRGKAEDFEALDALVNGARARLARRGELWLVTQRQVAIGPRLAEAFSTVEVAAQDSRFRVWRSR